MYEPLIAGNEGAEGVVYAASGNAYVMTANTFLVSPEYFTPTAGFIGDANGEVPMYLETLTTGQGFVGRVVL